MAVVLQNVYQMQVSSLKQHKQIVKFTLHLCDLDCNLVRNNSQISEKNPVSFIFMGGGNKIATEKIIYLGR